MSPPSLTSNAPEARAPDGPRTPYAGPLIDSLDPEDQTFLRNYIRAGSTRELSEMGNENGFLDLSSSSVSRRFIKMSRSLIDELNGRSLEYVNLAAIMVDGTGFGPVRPKTGRRSERKPKSRAIVWALGITVDGRKVLLGAVEGQSESQALVAKLFKQLGSQRLDLSDTLLVTDGGSAFNLLRMAHHKCFVHWGRNLAWQKLVPEQRTRLSGAIYRRYKHALGTANRTHATKELTELGEWMKQQGLTTSADSLLSGIDDRLALLELAPDDPEVRMTVGTTNLQEGAHDRSSEWKRHVKRWSPALDIQREKLPAERLDDRMRHFVASMTAAEQRWKPVRASKRGLENLTLAILLHRHPNIELDLINSTDGLTLARGLTKPSGDLHWRAAFRDLARWVDRNGKTLVIEGQALESLPKGVDTYLRRELGFVAHANEESKPSELRRLPQSPWFRHVRGVVDDRLVVALSEAALELAPGYVWLDEPELETAASRLPNLRTELERLESDIDAWGKANFEHAVKKVALARIAAAKGERARVDPIDPARWRLLGNRRAEWLMGNAAHLEGSGHAASQEARDRVEAQLGDPFAELDAIQARLSDAAQAVAASRELARRRELAPLRRRRAAGVTPDRAPAPRHQAPEEAVGPIARRVVALGTRNQQLLQAYADELAKKLSREDSRTLLTLRKNNGALWKDRLDGTKILKTRRFQTEVQQKARREFATTMRQRGPRDTRNGKPWKRLRAIDERRSIERLQGGGLDAFMTEFATEAAVDDAIEQILIGRAQAVEPGQSVDRSPRAAAVEHAATAEKVPAGSASEGLCM